MLLYNNQKLCEVELMSDICTLLKECEMSEIYEVSW